MKMRSEKEDTTEELHGQGQQRTEAWRTLAEDCFVWCQAHDGMEQNKD